MSEQETGEVATVDPINENQDTQDVEEISQSDDQVTDEGENTSESDDDGQGEKQKRPGKTQRKITWLEAENARKDRMIQDLQSQGKAEKQDEPKAPKPEDFDDVFEFLAADQKYNIQKALQEQQNQSQSKQQQDREDGIFQAKKNDYDQRLVSLVGQNQELANEILAMDRSGIVTPAIERSIYDSPVGEKITVHLAENPEVVMAIANLPENQQYLMMGRIEAFVRNNGNQSQPVRTTKAPDPINLPKSNQGNSSKNPWDMNQRDYENWLNKKP